jgi:predicted transcriptional regulator
MIERIKKEIEMFERHMEVLNLVLEEGPVGIVNLSSNTGYPRHKIRYSLRVLEEEELIEPTNSGAQATDKGREFGEEVNSKIDEISQSLEDMKI